MTVLLNVYNQYKANNLPLETIWHDLDYMDEAKTFTIDDTEFKGLQEFVNSIQDENRTYVPIVKPSISYRKGSSYNVFNTGVEEDVFIKSYVNGPDFIGKARSNDVVFPNFFQNQTYAWWRSNLDNFYSSISFDGLWLDSNEALNLCDGVCYSDQLAALPVRDRLRIVPTGQSLETQALPLDCWAFNLTDKDENGTTIQNVTYKEVDTHSLYGTKQTQVTQWWFEANDKRTMIVGRSSFAGNSKFGSRWIPDTHSNYTSMSRSVTGLMMSNMFGFPHSGADICGYHGNVTMELCTRWYNLGAFYPLSRNHQGASQADQEPYAF